MLKYLISFLLVFNCLLLAKYEDDSPTLTTNKDLQTLKDFEILLYKNTKVNKFQCNQKRILDFIMANKIETFDYNRLLVKLNAQVNNSENYSDENGTLKDRDKANIQLSASYPLYDKKTDLEIVKKKLDFKEKILNDISKLCDVKHEIKVLHNLIDLLNLKQIRAKAREDSGQIYLDERITLIEEIISKKNELNKLLVDFENLKLQLVNKVVEIKKNELENLL